MSDCKFCEGSGTVECFFDGPSVSGFLTKAKCPECNGAGVVDAEYFQRKERGKDLRKDRVSRGESLFDCAQRLGISTEKLSSMECGRLSE